MKLVVAFVHADHAHGVVQALERSGLFHVSFSRVLTVVQPDAPIFRPELASEGDWDVRLEAYCADDRVEQVMALIRERAHVGALPCGAVFVHPVEQAACLRVADTPSQP